MISALVEVCVRDEFEKDEGILRVLWVVPSRLCGEAGHIGGGIMGVFDECVSNGESEASWAGCHCVDDDGGYTTVEERVYFCVHNGSKLFSELSDVTRLYDLEDVSDKI